MVFSLSLWCPGTWFYNELSKYVNSNKKFKKIGLNNNRLQQIKLAELVIGCNENYWLWQKI